MSAGPSEPGSVAGPNVFITYRREETAAHAGRIYDAMVDRFGEGNVFMDVDMTPGVDFVERITEAVAACQVLIVVMGPRWATVENEQGTARIADPDDFVRLEVETALRRPEVTPIPVLVSGARMPSREVLPPGVQAITRRNALELSDSRWRYDIGRLISTLDELLAQTPLVDRPSPERRVGAEAAPTDAAQPSGETAPPSAPPSPDAATAVGETKRTARLWGGGRRRWLLLAAIAIAAIVVAVVVATLLSDPGPEGEFRGTELSELVLDEGPPGLLRDGSGTGYPPDALQGLPSPKGAFYREFTQENEDAMPYLYSLSAAAVFKNEDGARDALDRIRRISQGLNIQPRTVWGLGDQGLVIQDTEAERPQYSFAWRTGELLQYFNLVWVQEPPDEAIARDYAEEMAALVQPVP